MKKRTTISVNLAIVAACALIAVAVTSSVGRIQTSNSNTNKSMSQDKAKDHDDMHHGSMKMTEDQEFAMEAAMGGMMEVELGRMAAEKGASDEVRQFGQRMVDDHSKAGDDLKQVASGKGLTLPTAPDAKHQADMRKLSALSGAQFDKAYVSMMIKDHKKDVAEFQKEASKGMDVDIKSFASRTLPTLQTHLQMIQRINDKMMLRKNNKSGANTNSGQ